MNKYLLPCECGQHVTVEAGQAGLRVTCACGKTLEVPTMRGLQGLRAAVPAPDETMKAVPAAWGPGQGLLFLGALATLSGIIAVSLVLPNKPNWVVHKEQIAVDIDRLTPVQLWEHWQGLRKGLTAANDPVRQQYDADWATFRRRRTMAFIPLGIGILLLAAGFVLRRSRQAVSQTSST